MAPTTVPILLLIFNRPHTTAKVFERIRAQKPKQLFIAADGPRTNRKEDIVLCSSARQIANQVDWDCEVRTLFQSDNIGCGRGVAAGITWFFEQVSEGIILEDDCLPNDSFFYFCAELLSRYRDNNEVMMISGTTYQRGWQTNETYYFSNYPHVWGWATWKRAWDCYRFELDDARERAVVIADTFSNRRERVFWKRNMDMIVNGLDTWDYQWMYWIWKNNGLCITPRQNMISNIGFGPDASHTVDMNSPQACMPGFELTTVKHPRRIRLDKGADKYERDTILIGSAAAYYRTRLMNALKRFRRFKFYRDG